ncbi:DMT family transporter [Denitrobaculum tricleocarpae]|uniref:DMT family transporter n=1 Tax=Denitrobaculum tricleocarpae TaxID=2591009 RepID=A0A545TXB2_9PROT|nr:DMT family transporter [Denitrobaculum tricleocarpae]TQV81840.1 DMT family transporter [Denitrobaculum tricleocarpae]
MTAASHTQTQAPRDNLKLAVSVILVTVLTLSLNDALIKWVSTDLVLWQIFVLRSLFAVPLLLILLRVRFRRTPLRPRALGWTAARSLMLVFMWVAYYASLPHLQLSIAAASYYTLPIFITLFSALFVGERVGALGWLAVGLGFGGVGLVLKPTAGDFNLYALLPLLSAMLYALAMILTRTKCRDEHPLILSGALNLAFIAVGGIATLAGGITGGITGGFSGTASAASFLSPVWAPMAGGEVLAILLLTLAVLVASIGTAVAYQSGPSSVVATFDFAYVGFAVIWGFVFFAEVPDGMSLIGIALIVVAGVIAVRK